MQKVKQHHLTKSKLSCTCAFKVKEITLVQLGSFAPIHVTLVFDEILHSFIYSLEFGGGNLE